MKNFLSIFTIYVPNNTCRVDFKILSSSLDVNSNPELKEQMDKLRILAEKVNSEKVGLS
jgi:hypothetical protein